MAPQASVDILGCDGRVELGHDDFSRSLARIVDNGGLIWESDQCLKTYAP